MGKMNFDGFIARNGLVSLPELETSPYKPAAFSWGQAQSLIATSELATDDFYLNPGNPSKPYCYYRGSVFLEFASLDNDISSLKKRIFEMENQLNNAIADRDFARFLNIIDARLAADLFLEVFAFIPDQEKYPLFEQLLNDNQYCLQVFSPEFLKRASLYKNVTESLPLADDQGFVKIFSNASQPSEVNTQKVWYTDINNAIRKALSSSQVGDLFQAKVHLNDIKSYAAARLDHKVTLDPLTVKQVKHLDLIRIGDLLPLMQAQGLITQYYHFAGQIQTEWFHNPQGIHALSHTKRVLMLGLILAFLEQLPDQDRDLICQAAIYHDIGRITDGYDTGHGIASYQKLAEIGLLQHVPATEQETIRFIIEKHAVADKTALKQLSKYNPKGIEHTLKLYNIFKDADGLDRVRINDLNPDYLRSPSAQKLLLLAHQLYHTPEFEQLLASQL